MEQIKLDAYAKINLSLDVLFKREDGYHEINTIMQQIDLKDVLILKEIDEGIIIESNHPKLPLDSTNLVYKVWKLLKERYKVDRGVHITIKKNIPLASGLAGGSANAAAVFKGLNELWELNLSQEELLDLGVEIGADIPFCILGGTAQAEGIGEKLKKISSFSDKLVLLANPNICVSTSEVYRELKIDKITKVPNMEELVKSIERDDLKYLGDNMVNVLEEVTLKKHTIIKEIKEEMLKCGAIGSLMSGSGPTVFGLFDNEKSLHNCREKLEAKNIKIYVTKTI